MTLKKNNFICLFFLHPTFILSMDQRNYYPQIEYPGTSISNSISTIQTIPTLDAHDKETIMNATYRGLCNWWSDQSFCAQKLGISNHNSANTKYDEGKKKEWQYTQALYERIGKKTQKSICSKDYLPGPNDLNAIKDRSNKVVDFLTHYLPEHTTTTDNEIPYADLTQLLKNYPALPGWTITLILNALKEKEQNRINNVGMVMDNDTLTVVTELQKKWGEFIYLINQLDSSGKIHYFQPQND